MNDKITKCSEVYDGSKIGVGDIIEFGEWSVNPFAKKPKELYKRVGIVMKVEVDTVWVRSQNTYETHRVEEFGLPVERADEITILYRTHHNRKGTK